MGSRVSRRDFLHYAGIGVAGVVLAACQPKLAETPTRQATAAAKQATAVPEPTEAQATPAPQRVVEIQVTHSWPAELWPRQQQFDETFNKEHPTIKVTGLNIVWADYVPKLTTAAAGGSMPDIMYCQFAWAQKFIMHKAVISLQPFLDNDKEFWGKDDFNPESLKSYIWQNELYFIPYDEGPTNIIYYNKRILDEAKVPYPHSDKPWTLDDLLEAAKELTSGEGVNKIWGWGSTPGMGGDLNEDYLSYWGGSLWTEPCETECHINEDAAVQSLQWWADFRLKYHCTPTPAEAQTISGNPFGAGRVAMMKGASWDNRWVKAQLKDPYDVAHAPVGKDGKRHSSSMGSGYGITKDCKNPDVAWEWERSYLSTEGQIFMWAAPGVGSTTRWSAYPAYFSSPLAPKNAKVFMEALQDYAKHNILDSPNGYEITEAAQPIWDRALLSEISVKEACAQIAEAVKEPMSKNEEWCKAAGLT